MSFSIAQSRLVAKFLTGILGQRNNVTPCPKDCACVPPFRACGSGLRSIRSSSPFSMCSPSFVSGASPDQEPAADAVRARRVPMDTLFLWGGPCLDLLLCECGWSIGHSRSAEITGLGFFLARGPMGISFP